MAGRMLRIEDPKPLRWNKQRFHKLLDVFGVDRLPLELIDGEIIQKPPQKEPHVYTILRVDAALRKAFGSRYIIRTQMPMNIPGPHEPEPDVLVVKGGLRDMLKHPKHADLIVEVADSTLRYDRGRKGSLYAASRVRDYWIVNLLERQLEVRRDPRPDRQAEFGASYIDISVFKVGETVRTLAEPKAKIKVADLLP
jgi:Uma2 family endonuclease